MKYFSIDIETTGLNPETCNVIEIAAVFDDLSYPRPYKELPRFNYYVIPENGTYTGEPYALSMHPDIFKRIAKKEASWQYASASYVVNELRHFINQNLKNGDHLVFAGKNFGSFDLQFLKKLPNWDTLGANYRVIDPTALYLKVGEDLVPPSMAKCLERAGIKESVTHNALDDALQLVKLMRRGFLTKEGSQSIVLDMSKGKAAYKVV